MSGIKMVGDWSRLGDNLKKFYRISFTQLHQNIGEQIVNNTKDRFKKQRGPDNRPWVKSIRAKVERQGKTLMLTRRLYNSITYKAAADKVEIGTNVKYASTHQEGMTIKPKRKNFLKFKVGGSWRSVKKVVIPARPFMGINDDDREDVREIIQDEVERILK